MHLRQATPRDVAFLVKVVLETTSGHGLDSAGPIASASGAELVDDATRRILSDVEAGDTYVIELAGDPVGRLRVLRTADLLHLSGLQILPRSQSQGMGSTVIHMLMEESLSSGRVLELDVRTENRRARSLYERLGFHEVGVDGAEVRMRWGSRSHR